jgi:two-component system, cell cycle sensor histidine kinase and response regulator CckA
MTTARILVVEDERVVARDIQYRLTEMGHTVVNITRGGEEAVRLADELRPDLVLMDIRLDGRTDGISAAQEIRARFHLPIVFLTAYADEDTLQRARVTEPFGYVLKPFDERELRTVIEMALYKQDAERRLRASEEKYRSIFDNAIEGIFQTTPDGRFLTANRAMARMLGYDSPEELLGSVQNIESQLYVDQERRKEFTRRLSEHGFVQGFEAEIFRKDGTKGWGSLSSRAVKDAHGKLLYFEGRAEEITERKRLEEQFRQAQKMEAIGQLAGGIAHDFNNLLTVINGYSALLVDNRDPDDPDTEALAEIRNAGERAAVLTRQLLAFSRKQLLQLQVIDLNSLVTELAKMLRRLIGEHIVLNVDTDPTLDLVKVDPRQFEQVLLNLAVNARDAMSSGGTLTIGTQNVRLAASDAERFAGMRPGRYVRLWVSDTGHGVPEAIASRIFEPFFTTKPLGEGTGLGLAVVHGIVRQNGGHIELDSEIGVGTTFNIYIPVAEGSVASPRPSSQTGMPKGHETILLVDDDEGVRALAASVLRSSGYAVLEAADGPEALSVARRYPEAIQLLLTDMGMPYMTGRQLAHVLRAERPDVRVLFVSGYAAESSGPAPGSTEHWLAKPFAPLTLALTVRQILDSR